MIIMFMQHACKLKCRISQRHELLASIKYIEESSHLQATQMVQDQVRYLTNLHCQPGCQPC